MHSVVFGCNQFGVALAQRLSRQKHNVVVVDEAQSSFSQVPADFGGFVFSGPLAEASTWEQARLSHAQVVFIVIESFTTALMLAGVAQKHYHVPRVICLAQDRHQAEMLKRLGVEAVQTDQLIAETLERHLSVQGDVQ